MNKCKWGWIAMLVVAFISGCSHSSIYTKKNEEPFLPREYYRKHLEFGSGFSSPVHSPLIDKIKAHQNVKDVTFLTYDDKTVIAIKPKAYARVWKDEMKQEISSMLGEEKGAIVITMTPDHFRTIKSLSRKRQGISIDEKWQHEWNEFIMRLEQNKS